MMKAQEYYEKYFENAQSADEIRKNTGEMFRDILKEYSEISEKRKPKTTDGVVGIVRELNDKWNSITPSRDIIKILKDSGNHVQILTKNGADAARDFDLLDSGDWFGITYTGYSGHTFDRNYIPQEEPHSGSPHDRLLALATAHQIGIKTWVSAEPVLNDADVLDFIDSADYVDLWKIGKLNYHPSTIDWKRFGEAAESLLQSKRRSYYIKESLRAEMERDKP